MKKITTGILATLACLACLSGCSGKGSEKDPTGIEASVALEGAKAFLEAKYKKQVSEVSANYELPNTVTYDGVTYELTWSVDVENDVVVERDDEEGITYINVNESALEEVKYTLTGTIKDADGNELKVDFKCKLLQGPTTAAVRITEAPVVGTAYKLYVYQGANSAHIYANGKMKNTYYFDTTDVAEDGIDIYVEAVEGQEGKFYLYHNVVEGEGEEATTTKTYINIVKSGTHINAKYETTATTAYVFDSEYKTMVAELEGTKYYLGCDGTFNTIEPQKTVGEGYYTAYLSGIVDKKDVTEEVKLETAFNTLTMPAAYVDEFDTALPTQDPTFTDVKINWECDSDKVTLGQNINDTQKANFKAGSTTDTVVLKAVMTCGDEKATKEFSVKLVPNDGEAIVAAANELKVGASFGNEATLTGMVTKLDRSGLAQYANIEVSIAANGNVNTLIGCYHLVGITDYQADKVDYGYNVTVKGILTNYNGTIQFGNGCEIVSFTEGSRNDIPGIKTTPAEIVDAAYALEDGQSMYVDYTLTGVITKVNTKYSSDNKNVTVTIAVEGKEDKPIMCYRLKGEGADVIKVGDTITVTGTLKSYNGTIEFDTGCRLDSYVVGEGGSDEGGDEQIPEADSVITIAQAVALGSAQEHNTYTADKYYVSGTITEVKNTTYGNVVISDGTNSILVYGLYLEDNTRYDAMQTKPVVGDTIKVYGVLGQFNGTPQFKDAWLTEHTPGEGGGDVGGDDNTGDDNTGDEATDPLASKIVTSPVAGTAYNFYMYQGKAKAVAYLAGGMSSYYLATTSDASAALTVYLEETTGGYYMYCYVDEVKTYINMVASSNGFVNGAYEATASTVYTFDTTYNTLVNADGYFFGTRGDKDYTTMGPCANNYIAENFVAHFVEDDTVSGGEEGGSGEVTPPVGGGDEGGDNDGGDTTITAPAADSTLTIAQALEYGATLSGDTTDKYYVSGTITGFYNNGTTYGNVYIEDENGDSILIYGISNEDGTVRYDSLTIKPTIGDTVTVYGILSVYNSTPQFKNTWLKEYTIIDENKVAAEKEALKVETARVTESTSITLPNTYSLFDNATIAWELVEGNECATLTDNVLAITLPEANTAVKVKAIICVNEASDEKEFIINIVAVESEGEQTLATFEFGANGTASHVDGNELGSSKSYTDNGYTLSLTGMSKVYGPAYDAKGNSCIKLGTSKLIGSLSFTVANEVTKVVIKVAKYKTYASKININGTDYTLTKNSNNGEYDEITIDTNVTKTVTFATVASTYRAMINSITFIG